jgi:hypothetical protein
MYAGTGNKRTR